MPRHFHSPAQIVGALFVILANGCGPKPEPKADPTPAVAIQESSAQPTTNAPPTPEAGVEAIRRSRDELDASLWKDEELAQKYEQTFVNLWDRLRGITNKLAVLKAFPFTSLTLGSPAAKEMYPHGIRMTTFGKAIKAYSPAEFGALLDQFAVAGFSLEQTEWHHQQFLPMAEGGVRSVFSAKLHVRNAKSGTRYILNAKLEIKWLKEPDVLGLFVPDEITVGELSMWERSGPDAFRQIGLQRATTVSPMTVIARDLTGDGRSEILLPTENRAYSLDTNGVWRPFLFIKHYVLEDVDTDLRWVRSVVADFSGDGKADLVMAIPNNGVYFYEADERGFFTKPYRKVFGDAETIVKPSVLSVGDVNRDGRLDLWLGQYLPAYIEGKMPSPFYDANDGPPSYLLINDGNASFHDGTVEAGLGKKRNRRVFSGSFLDWDEDGDLDLITVSDFSGVDVFRNDGIGKFADVTDQAVDDRANFGMAHAVGDFNRDGRLDLFVTGMASTTARRLEALGLTRPEFPEYRVMRNRMAYGNRLYFNDGKGGMKQPGFGDSVARSGWSWGTAAFDFGNDGWLDIYVGNGHVSGKSSKDYCTRYWRHDIYMESRVANPVFEKLFKQELGQLGEISWNGFEKNVLFLNVDGTNFINAAYLFDLAMDYDSRAVLTDDFDLDGRLDVVVVKQDFFVSPPFGYDVNVYRNEWTNGNHWVGVVLRDGKSVSSFGARVRVTAGNSTMAASVVTGDSLWVQHAPLKHFGLGAGKRVEKIVISWPDGTKTTLENPGIDQYHTVSPLEPEK